MKVSFLEQSFGRKREEQCLCESSLPHGAAGASSAPQQYIHIPVEKLSHPLLPTGSGKQNPYC